MKKWLPTRLSSSQMEQDDLYLIHMEEANLNYMLAVNQRLIVYLMHLTRRFSSRCS